MNKFLIVIQAYLLGRTGSRLVGLLLLLSLIWWAGPSVGLQSENLRFAIIGGILLLVLTVWLVRLFLVRRKSANFQKELRAQGGAGSGHEREIEELRKRMDEAIASLKSSELGLGYRGNAALYALPWFMIIGPAAAGKSTLLRNSGLQFPYAQGRDIDIKGVGGTRNCDWWFSNEAVLLDTAGRYTTEEDDHQEWSTFLSLLKKYRSRLPLNGVLVAVSLADLLIADEGGLEKHVKIIRDRLHELTSQLGCSFPIYIVLTKCDLLHGFEAFFQDLGDHDRDQIWGAWLAQEKEDQDLANAFDTKMAELHRRLSELRMRKLSMQRKFESKQEIFDFPAQFQATAEKLVEFVNLLVQKNPYRETPRFCGIYFTSATQEGTPIQRIVGNLRQAFGYVENELPAASRSPKSFFIKKLFQDVIFPNAQGAGKNRHSALVNRSLKTAWIVGCLALIAGSVLLLSTALTSNTLLLNQGTDLAQSLQVELTSEQPSAERGFNALGSLYEHRQTLLGYEKHLPWHLMFGIYQGEKQLEPTRALLLRALEHSYFLPVATALEYRLENDSRQWEALGDKGQEKIREDYYQNLKLYLMLADPQRLGEEQPVPELVGLWKELIRRSEPERTFDETEERQLTELVGLHLQHLQLPAGDPHQARPLSLRPGLVDLARNQLRTPPNAERLFAQVLSKGKLSLPDLKLADLTKGSEAGVLSSGYSLPGVYTEKGWREFVHAEIKKVVTGASRGDWVIDGNPEEIDAIAMQPSGSNAETAKTAAKNGQIDEALARRLEQEIRQLYFHNYASVWYELLESVRVAKFRSLGEASQKLQILARSNGPVAELLREVSKNINLSDPATGGGLAPAVDAAAEVPKPEPRLVSELDAPLRDLRKFVDPGEDMTVSPLLDQYLRAVSSVQGEAEKLAAAADVGREAKNYAANILSGGGAGSDLYKGWSATSSLLNNLDPRTRRVASRLLTDPMRHVWGSIMDQSRQGLQRDWKALVVGSYNGKLRGRFPFDRKGKDVALADMSDFFRPTDGAYWSFVQNELAPFLAEGRRSWTQKSWLDQSPGFNDDFLRSLARARTISDSLFRRGQDEPEIRFSVYPMPTRGLSEMFLEANGQNYRYRNEPQEWRPFRWPNGEEKVGARVHGIAGKGAARGQLEFDGVWGIFHLLEEAKTTRENGTEFLSSWELRSTDGTPITVQFKIKADRENNVFDQNLFAGFNVPDSLF
jgi:type VI secretion system protein ImpL